MRNYLNICAKCIGIIYIIMYISCSYLIVKLDVLPFKYFIILFIISLFISVFLSIILINKKSKKKLKILSIVISIILIIIYSTAGYYLYYTVNFMKNIKKDNSQMEKYYVVVNKKGNYKKLSNLSGNNIYVLDSKEQPYINAKKKLQKKIDISYKSKDSLDSIYKTLLNDNPIFISSNVYRMLSEGNYKLSDKSKIIYTIYVKTNVKEIDKSVNTKKESFNVYISGTDSAGKISNVGRSDVNMIVTVNPTTNKILLTSIPRDYYIKLHNKNAYDKLTHSSIYGINETISSVEDLLNTDINYYVKVNFSTLIKLVDVVGGIDVYSDYTFTTHGTGTKYSFYKGINKLNGEKALAFSRERKSFKDGDRQRIKNQQKVLTAIVTKMSSTSTILTNYNSILETLQTSFQTNMSQDDITKLVKLQISELPSWNIENNSLEGVDDHKMTYTYGAQSLYVMVPDSTSVLDGSSKINAVLEKN